MFKKIVFLFLFFTFSVFANDKLQNVNMQKFQLMAKSVETEAGNMLAKGHILLTTPKYYIMADELRYSNETEVAEVFGNVVIIQNGVVQMQSEYAYFDFKKDINIINPILLLDTKTKLWINSKKIDANSSEQNFATSTISSCNCVNPAWSMRVSSANNDVKNQWMHLYNMRLYIGSVPIFYLPYFGYPTDNTRRSGLLIPTMGASSKDGVFYAQPIYFAPAQNWDLEFIPQTRSKRGNGLYSTYRYADSKYSNFIFKTGLFKNKEEYKEEHSLENEKHYGFNLEYNRSSLFEGQNSNDELSIWIDWMNDIDYKNLDTDNLSATGDNTTYGTNRESYINYYFDTAKWYNGVYFKYYLDTSKDNNDDTLQQLPVYQSHLYTDSLIFDKLTYSADLQNTNYYRKSGIKANKTDINIPLSYEFSLFDDYLFFEYKEDMTFSSISYDSTDDSQKFEDGKYLRKNQQFTLSTDLMKPYEKIAHSINLSLEYTTPKIYKQEGELYGVTSDDNNLSDFTFSKANKSLSLGAKQYFYDLKTKKLLVSDFLSQSYEYKNEQYVATNLENQFTFNYSLGSISNRIIYNQEDKDIILNSSSFNMEKDDKKFKISHYKTKKTENTSYSDDESMTLDLSFSPAKRYTFSYVNNYDLEAKESSKESYSLKYNEKCWSVDLKLENSLVTSASTTSSAVRQDVIYITFELKPLGGYVFKRELDESNK